MPTVKHQICSQVTNYEHNLKKHLVIHKSLEEISKNLPKFKYHLCAYVAKRKDHLIRYIAHKSPKERKKLEELKSFKDQQKLRISKSTFSCHLCSYKAKQKRNLKIHIIAHKSPK